VISLLISHSVSRWSAVQVSQNLPYAREPGSEPGSGAGKTRPATKIWTWQQRLLALLVAVLPIALMPRALGLTASISVLCCLTMQRYFKRRLGGYTGDCLGAVQQITEICLLIGLVFQCKYG
jgi:adenosylcobinamide-GDP ribazoletransferase